MKFRNLKNSQVLKNCFINPNGILSEFKQIFFHGDVSIEVDLELIASTARSNRECQVDAAKNIVRVGFAIEQGLTFIVTLFNK